MRLHFIHIVDRIVNCMIVEVDVIVGLCPHSHHLHLVFTWTLDDLWFGV